MYQSLVCKAVKVKTVSLYFCFSCMAILVLGKQAVQLNMGLQERKFCMCEFHFCGQGPVL